MACVALALAGCGGGSSKTTTPVAAVHTPLVPWSGSLPAELQVPAAHAAAACRAADLRVEGGGFNFQPTAAGASGTVELRNVGHDACRLVGRPHVRFVGAPRMPRPSQVARPVVPRQYPGVSRPAARREALPPGTPATLTVDWSNWCPPGPHTSAAIKPPSAARVTLPGGGGNIDVPYNAVTTCAAPGAPSVIGVQPFQPPLLPTIKPWSTVLLIARILILGGAPGPLHARRGQVLRYSVQLRNASQQTLTFTRCPLFAQVLAPDGSTSAGMLNCAAAHAVAPGHAIRFEMRITVPGNSPLGDNGLLWTLDPVGVQGPEAVGHVIVAPAPGHRKPAGQSGYCLGFWFVVAAAWLRWTTALSPIALTAAW